jgi:hypothetical protein
MRVAYRHQHVGRSYPFGEDGGHDQLGMRDQPWMIGCNGRSALNSNAIGLQEVIDSEVHRRRWKKRRVKASKQNKLERWDSRLRVLGAAGLSS